MPYLDVEGDRVHYLDEGSGVPIVFIHGSCGGAGQWKSMSSALASRFRTVCIDMPGHGQSSAWPLDRKWSLDDDERAIEAVLSKIEGVFHVVVHSAGGRTAFRSIRTHRDRIKTVTMFEPVYFHWLRHLGDALFSEPTEMSKRYRENIEAGDYEGAMAHFVDAWVKKEGAWISLPASIKDKMWAGAGRLYHEWLMPWEDEPTIDDLKELDLPLLVIKGSDTIGSMDRVCELLCSEIPGCRVIEVPGAGHMCPFTHWHEVLPIVEEHIAGNSMA